MQNQELVKTHIQANSKKVRTQSGISASTIAKQESAGNAAISSGQKSAGKRNHKAWQGAAKTLLKETSSQKKATNNKYRDWKPKYRSVGTDVDKKARQTGETMATAWEGKKNGKSTWLDGPIHDNRMDAKAKAARQVSGEYGKSFKQAAIDQANKLHEGKPGIISKIDEIAKQAGEGLQKQKESIEKSVEAIKKSSSTQISDTAKKMNSANHKATKQSKEALETQQTAQLGQVETYGKAQRTSLEQTAINDLSLIHI